MIKKEIIDNNSGKYRLIVEGIDKEFSIFIGGADLYFYLNNYEEGHCVTILKNDEAYEILEGLLKKIKSVDNKQQSVFTNGVFKWISDSGIPEECNTLEVYNKDDSLVFNFWRNDIRPYRNCSISFCTCGAINQNLVNELMYFFNSYLDESNENRKILKKNKSASLLK